MSYRGTKARKSTTKKSWAGSKFKKTQDKKLKGKTISSGRGTGTRVYKATKTKTTKKRKPSKRSGRGYLK